MMVMVRTEQEIVARARQVRDDRFRDPLGAELGDLITQLEWDEAKEFLHPGAKKVDWHPLPLQEAKEGAIGYVQFAISKMDHHRGLSAGRSVDHMRAWIWLFTDDDWAQKMDEAPYQNYGAPKVKVFCEAMGLQDVWDLTTTPEVRNMAEGKPCREGCEEGCGK
jgi:hypothetical protein